MRIAWLLALWLVGCVEAKIVECDNGTVCPDGKICDTAFDTCVDPDQIRVCDLTPNLTECTWSNGTGRCYDGVCRVPGCGNRIVEPDLGESCDDGNQIALDDCSADCTSTEVCGNGVVDVLKAEECDDRNLRSHDGCDSTCRTESLVWTTTGVGMPPGRVGRGAFDEGRKKLVHFSDGVTWEYDGTSWRIAATSGVPAAAWFALVYDFDRQVVVLVGGTTSIVGVKPIDLLYEWDGQQWTAHPSNLVAQADVGIAAYDRKNHRIVVYAGTRVWQLDSSTPVATWAPLPTPPPIAPVPPSTHGCSNQITPGGQSIVYDHGRDKIVLVQGGFQDKEVLNPIPPGGVTRPPAVLPLTWELDGETWTCFPDAPFPITDPNLPNPDSLGAPSLVYDPVRQAVLGLGGNRITDSLFVERDFVLIPDVIVWNPAAPSWTLLPEASVLPTPANELEVVFDTERGSVFAFGNLGVDNDLFQLTTSGWKRKDHPDPKQRSTTLTAFDTRLGRLVLVQADFNVETWTWDGTWSKADIQNPPLLPGATMIYDPVRDGVVLLDQDTKTWILRFDGNAYTWTQLGLGVVQPTGMVFDPFHRRLVALATGGVFTFDESDVWVANGPPPPIDPSPPSVAWDAHNNVLVAMGGQDGKVVTFDGQSWTATLTPSDASYRIVADQRRGSVNFVSSQGIFWERIGTNWGEYGTLPVPVEGVPHYDAKLGRLVMVGNIGESRMIITRQLAGQAVTETCAGADDDGDGLIDCDDDDCFWRCSPECPPFSSCPL